jgi:hypothetical protein|tara:strand:+ start:189 stop:335 length:147 start_codon:yes stop_codon:yes gene_type:complete
MEINEKELKLIRQEMENIRELYLKGYITKEVYQKETRVVFEIASTLGV